MNTPSSGAATEEPSGSGRRRLRLADRLTVGLATGGWVGLMPTAPGTFGALWGLPLAWLVERAAGAQWPLQLAMIVVLLLASVPVCTAAAALLGGKKDPGAIVLDEIASMPIVFLGVPLDRWGVVLLGFALHRLFDISKPPPARQLERLPAGWGIMADDVAAGLYACVALHLVAATGVFGG
ncbi:MAG: phosphatidylglycerophosphatase A [Planctomycetales bacterium]|nr:phosphatidylglycerophosphatase A [Planctomycetales bacterium]